MFRKTEDRENPSTVMPTLKTEDSITTSHRHPQATKPQSLLCPSGHKDDPITIGDWWAARAIASAVDIPALLRREELDGSALRLATVAQLHELGIPLGAVLKIKACFDPPPSHPPSAVERSLAELQLRRQRMESGEAGEVC